MRVGVIGAGIVGASIAYHLAKRGAKVTIFDAHPVGSGVSSSSFACLNAFGRSGEDLEFRLQAIRYHRTLAAEIGGAHLIQQCGTLRIASADDVAAKMMVDAEVFEAAGGAVTPVSNSEMIDLEPRIHTGLAVAGWMVREEGWVNSGALCQLLVKIAIERFGARFIAERISGIEMFDQRAELRWRLDRQTFDRVALAAGNDTNLLLERAGLPTLPIQTVPGPLLTLADAGRSSVVRHVVYADGFHIRPDPEGLMAGVSALPGELEPLERVERERVQLVAAGSRWVEGFLNMPRRWVVCPRPMPRGDRPIVGLQAKPVFVAVMHGGVTLAPLVGKIAAAEIIDGIGASARRAKHHEDNVVPLSEREHLPTAWQTASA